MYGQSKVTRFSYLFITLILYKYAYRHDIFYVIFYICQLLLFFFFKKKKKCKSLKMRDHVRKSAWH